VGNTHPAIDWLNIFNLSLVDHAMCDDTIIHATYKIGIKIIR
jgi:hypothetical protein